MSTARQLVERSLAAFADRIAIDDEGQLISYRTLADRSARLANAFLSVGGGRPVAIWLPNSFHFAEVDLACMRAGVLRVGISSRLSADESRFIIRHSRAGVLVTSRRMFESLDPEALDELACVALVDGKMDDRAGLTRGYEGLVADGSSSLSVPPVGPDHPAYVLYTSGTTGRPKGALHTQGSRVAALVNMMANELVIDGRSAMVHCGALTHGSGSKLLSFLSRGACNIILPRFDPDLLADAIDRRGGTHTFIVPTMLQMLEEAGPKARDSVRRMRQISFGGAPISNAAFGRAVEAFGSRLVQVYGTSEAPHPVTVLRPEDYEDAPDPAIFGETAGRAATGVEIMVVGDDGDALPAGDQGELLVRGPSVMRGYLHDPQATAEVLDVEGWYRTGDVASIDETGLVRICDRKRDLIISGGLNIYPSEVERVLAGHEAIREVAVVGLPDDKWGETVSAFIVRRAGAKLSEDGLATWLEGRIAGYKKPRRITFLDELPKGSTSKVLKRALRELHEKEGRGGSAEMRHDRQEKANGIEA